MVEQGQAGVGQASDPHRGVAHKVLLGVQHMGGLVGVVVGGPHEVVQEPAR